MQSTIEAHKHLWFENFGPRGRVDAELGEMVERFVTAERLGGPKNGQQLLSALPEEASHEASRTNAESTAGRGRNAPAGTTNRRSTLASTCTPTDSAP